jgi:hypothetical protein
MHPLCTQIGEKKEGRGREGREEEKGRRAYDLT